MKSFLITLALLLSCASVFAQSTCSPPPQETVIYFGNGINTERESARESLRVLRTNLGDTYNGQKLRYDLAYNSTYDIGLDLYQSALQAGAQFGSEVTQWLSNVGLAPDWFVRWYREALISIPTIIAPDVIEHVDKYNRSISQGKNVLLIAHSQGNFYANEAKKLLAQQITAEQMKSFAVFGVAVPANNIGGASSPYYTNHRDVIQYVPSAMPVNWTLRQADGSSAEDVSLVQAHLFNSTYLSGDFDIRPVLLLGFKSQLNSLKIPVPDCKNYRRYFIGQLAGIFPASCNGVASTAAVSNVGVITFPNGVLDLTIPDVGINFLSRQLVNTSSASDNTGIGFDAGSKTTRVGGFWSPSGQFKQLQRSHDMPMSCQHRPTIASSFLSKSIDIAQSASVLMQGYNGVFTSRECSVIDKTMQTTTGFKTVTPVSLEGTTLYVGENSYELSAIRTSEFVSLPAASSFVPIDYEPQFSLSTKAPDQTQISLTYKQFTGLASVLIDTPIRLITCNK